MSHTSRQRSRSLLFTLVTILFLNSYVVAQTSPSRAVVVDERLSVLRTGPGFGAPLLKRLGRGRRVTIVGGTRVADIHFYRVAVTRRTRGWIQREALVVPARRGNDERLLQLIRASSEFDRIVRARIFLDLFPRSQFRPAVLALFGDEATKAARKLTHDAARRLDPAELEATGASPSSYFLNYVGLDRYRRQGIVFKFDPSTQRFDYDGAAWRELRRRYPQSAEARRQ